MKNIFYDCRLELCVLTLSVQVLAAAVPSPVPASGSQAGDWPVISVASVQNNQARSAMREVLQRVLLSDYQCHVLDRSSAFGVYLEKNLRNLKDIDSAALPGAFSMGVDYGVSANYHFQKGKGGSSEWAIKGSVCCCNLRERILSSMITQDFNRDKHNELEEDGVAEEIAKAIHLSRRQPTMDAQNSVRRSLADKTWVVLPLNDLVYDVADTNYMARARDLSRQIEDALMGSGQIKRIVDHQNLQNILNERKLAAKTLEDSRYGLLLAKYAHADYILTGSLIWRGVPIVELRLLDVRSSIILAATKVPIKSYAQAEPLIAEGVKKLLDKPYVPPPSKPTTRQQCLDEVTFLTSAGPFLQNQWRIPWLEWLPNMETVLLLAGDDVTLRYQTAAQVTERLRDMVLSPYRWSERGMHEQRAAELVNAALAGISHTTITPFPLLIRAEANLLAGKPAEADRLAGDHQAMHPGVATAYAAWIRISCSAMRGDWKAVETYQKSMPPKQQILPDTVCTYNGEHNDWCRDYPAKLKALARDPAKAGTDREKYEILKERLLVNGRHNRENGIYKSVVGAAREGDDWFMFVPLAIQFDGPDQVLQIIKANVPYYLRFLAGWGEAHCLAASGKFQEAANLCAIFINISKLPELVKEGRGSTIWPALVTKDLYALLDEIKKQHGPILPPKPVLMPSLGRQLPLTIYKIYLVPVGDISTALVAKVAATTEKFSGITTGVLPSLPLPPSAHEAYEGGSFHHGGIDGKHCMPDLLSSRQIPGDALLVCYLCNEKLAETSELYRVTPDAYLHNRVYNPVLISFSYLSFNDQINQSCELIMRALNTCYAYFKFVDCRNYPCLFCRWDPWFSLYVPDIHPLPLRLCRSCLMDFQNANFATIHNDLLAFMKANKTPLGA